MTAATLDHISQSTRRLLWQFRDKPRFRSLVQAIGAELNELETALAQVRDLRIASEGGVSLDGDGALVGVTRAGRTDTDYRAAVQAQILINRGQARIEDLNFALNLVLPDSVFAVSEPEPAHVDVDALPLGGTAASAAAVIALLDDLVGGGVAVRLFYSDTDAANGFTFAVGDAVQADAARGFADNAGSVGGRFSDAIGADE